jgi:hypothetical protein
MDASDIRRFSDRQLERERARRTECRDTGVCCFCDRPYTEEPCSAPDRHALAGAGWHNGWKMLHGSSYLQALFGGSEHGLHITISRYGGSVSLSEPQLVRGHSFVGGTYRTELALDGLDDRARFEKAVDHVIEHLANRPRGPVLGLAAMTYLIGCAYCTDGRVGGAHPDYDLCGCTRLLDTNG